MNIKQIGIDIGKMTFHMVALDEANDIVIRRQFTRSQLIIFFTKRADESLNVAFEACSGAHWLAHQLIGFVKRCARRGNWTTPTRPSG